MADPRDWTRREGSAARGAATSAERRTGKPGVAHHRGDPGTSDRLYSPEEERFLRAVDAWRARTARPFPTACDFLAILKSLGYREPGLDDPPPAG
jgi:hypothetical protein